MLTVITGLIWLIVWLYLGMQENPNKWYCTHCGGTDIGEDRQNFYNR
jgi:hypothetical protein